MIDYADLWIIFGGVLTLAIVLTIWGPHFGPEGPP